MWLAGSTPAMSIARIAELGICAYLKSRYLPGSNPGVGTLPVWCNLVDAHALGACIERCGGSNPLTGTSRYSSIGQSIVLIRRRLVVRFHLSAQADVTQLERVRSLQE